MSSFGEQFICKNIECETLNGVDPGTVSTDTLDDVCQRGPTTTENVLVGGLSIGANNFRGDLIIRANGNVPTAPGYKPGNCDVGAAIGVRGKNVDDYGGAFNHGIEVGTKDFSEGGTGNIKMHAGFLDLPKITNDPTLAATTSRVPPVRMPYFKDPNGATLSQGATGALTDYFNKATVIIEFSDAAPTSDVTYYFQTNYDSLFDGSTGGVVKPCILIYSTEFEANVAPTNAIPLLVAPQALVPNETRRKYAIIRKANTGKCHLTLHWSLRGDLYT